MPNHGGEVKNVLMEPYRSNIEEAISVLYLIAGIPAFNSSNRFLHYLSFYLFFNAITCTAWAIISAVLCVWTKSKNEAK